MRWVLGLLSLLVPAAAPTAPLSTSKLSLHLIARYTRGARQVVSAGPRVLKVLDLGDDMRAALRDYKARFPQGRSVLRIYTRIRYETSDDPERSARDFWDRALAPPLAGLPPAERRLIDYLEGPNEGDSTPTWESVESARWFGRFWAALAPLIRRNGYRPCVGSVPVGNPPGSPDEVSARWDSFVPALEAARLAGGAWSYHAYSIEYSTDPAKETWYSLRYRQLHDRLARRHPDLAKLPLILTEGGVDRDGNPRTSGFQARGAAGDYERWLAWFDREIRRDPYVLGVTLFQSGDAAGWPSFDVEPVAAWLSEHLRRAR